jgi:Amidohydrolase family
VAITHVTLIDATGSPPRPETTVIIDGSKISAVGPDSSIDIPRGARIINATGKFLIPGLADMHLHLLAAGEPSGSREFFFPLLIANGITTVRDMGGEVDLLKQLRKEISDGKIVGPRIFFTGPYLDGNPPSFKPSIVVQNAAEAETAVRQLKSEGVDFIKVQERLDPQAYFAVARESKKQGIRFVGHVPDSISPAAASDAGQASIEHLTGILLACSSEEEKLRNEQLVQHPKNETSRQTIARQRIWQQRVLDTYSPEKATQLFQKFVANGTWQVPTLPLLIDLAYLTPENEKSNDPNLKYVPQDVLGVWKQGRHVALASRGEVDFTQRLALVNSSMAAVRNMFAAGVGIMAGTDSPAPNVIPAFALHEDLVDLVRAGLTPMQALQAATSKPAEFLGLQGQQGTIAPRLRADLVLLDADPLEDIRNTEKIEMVIVNGKILDRSDLDALLRTEERFAATH